jgi:hypothetical protein
MYICLGNGPKIRVCRRAVITLCGIGVHRNGRTDDTFVTTSVLYIADLFSIYYPFRHPRYIAHALPFRYSAVRQVLAHQVLRVSVYFIATEPDPCLS